jgi:hypothetical protein
MDAWDVMKPLLLATAGAASAPLGASNKEIINEHENKRSRDTRTDALLRLRDNRSRMGNLLYWQIGKFTPQHWQMRKCLSSFYA